jgi:hypothetical protein
LSDRLTQSLPPPHIVWTMAPLWGAALEIELLDDMYHTPIVQVSKREKSVSFSEDVSELYYIPNLEDMTKEDYQATYLTESDYRRMQRESEQTLSIMRQGKYPGTTDRYFRGLEISLPQSRMERKRRTDFLVSTILQEQEGKQRHLHPQWIQNFYSRMTAPSMEVAHAMGKWDAAAAQAEEEHGEAASKRR